MTDGEERTTKYAKYAEWEAKLLVKDESNKR